MTWDPARALARISPVASLLNKCHEPTSACRAANEYTGSTSARRRRGVDSEVDEVMEGEDTEPPSGEVDVVQLPAVEEPSGRDVFGLGVILQAVPSRSTTSARSPAPSTNSRHRSGGRRPGTTEVAVHRHFKLVSVA